MNANLHEIQEAVEHLPDEEFAKLRDWLAERDWERWDRQIEEDSKAGKFNDLIAKARAEKAAGTDREL